MAELGRPSIYTLEIADEVCRRLADGESLLAICADDEMPAESTVRHWAMEDRQGFFAKYSRARAIQAHGLFDETLEIADDGDEDGCDDGVGYLRLG